HPGYLFDFWEINGKKYYDQEMRLDWYMSTGATDEINAKLFVKPDETYHDIVIQTIRPDESCDTITLFNPGANETMAEDLYLSNDKSDLQKFNIKKVRFPAKSTMTYYGEKGENTKASHVFGFKLKKGDTIYLSNKEGTILCEVYIPENLNIYKNEQISRNGDGSYKVERIG
ncbi:MAG: hypothetical protein FWH48_06520, partial [Oscillospiraceae bacterium]|nr:hypothetical protein [Oscillospiraceae bacterium]